MQRAPPAPATQFIAGNRKDGNAGFVVFFVGPDVALVAHHHAGTQGEHVIGVIPLFALSFKCVAASGD